MVHDMSSVQDRVEGVLIGLAAGDRIGGPVRMAIRLAESLLERGAFDCSDVAARYQAWWREGAFDTGPVAARVFELVASGYSFDAASERVHLLTDGETAGCNPAHRSAPLAMMPGVSYGALANFARTEAVLTHRHPLAGDVAAAVVLICRSLIEGLPWSAAREVAEANALPQTRATLQVRSVHALRKGGFAPEALAAAVYFVTTHDSFGKALDAALRFAGPSNYCPVLVGSLGGARWGSAEISEQMLSHCQILARVRSAASDLAELWA